MIRITDKNGTETGTHEFGGKTWSVKGVGHLCISLHENDLVIELGNHDFTLQIKEGVGLVEGVYFSVVRQPYKTQVMNRNIMVTLRLEDKNELNPLDDNMVEELHIEMTQE